MLKVREEIFQEYFGLTWDDIFNHPTFLNQQQNGLLWYSDGAVEFMKEVHQIMKPGAKPDSNMIARAEKQHNSKAYIRQDRATAEQMTPVPFPEFLKTVDWS